MKFTEAVQHIDKHRDKVAVAVNREEMEIYIIEYYSDFDNEEDGYVGVHHEKDEGMSIGTEDFFNVEEFQNNFDDVDNLEFREVDTETASNLYGSEFWYQLEVLGLE